MLNLTLKLFYATLRGDLSRRFSLDDVDVISGGTTNLDTRATFILAAHKYCIMAYRYAWVHANITSSLRRIPELGATKG